MKKCRKIEQILLQLSGKIEGAKNVENCENSGED